MPLETRHIGRCGGWHVSDYEKDDQHIRYARTPQPVTVQASCYGAILYLLFKRNKVMKPSNRRSKLGSQQDLHTHHCSACYLYVLACLKPDNSILGLVLSPEPFPFSVSPREVAYVEIYG